MSDAVSTPPSTDPRSLPFFRYTKGERKFLRIKQKLTDDQLYQLRANMNELRAQQMRPEGRAEVQRASDTAIARRDGTS